MHKIEGKLLEKYEKVCKILKTNDLGNYSKLLFDETIAALSKKIIEIKEKQHNCLKAFIDNIKAIELNLTKNTEESKNESEEDKLKNSIQLFQINNIQLKIDLIKEKIKNSLYSESNAQALNIIKDELINTYDEYIDIRALLKDRVSVYETNPQLAMLASQYSILMKRIQQKQNDINSISQ